MRGRESGSERECVFERARERERERERECERHGEKERGREIERKPTVVSENAVRTLARFRATLGTKKTPFGTAVEQNRLT